MAVWPEVVARTCQLILTYNGQGIRPTLRQVHYRLASEQVGGYQNTQGCYKALSERLVKARKDGLVPWDALADHVRYRLWDRPKGGQVPDLDEVLERAVEGLGEDPWEAMGKRVILWLEKDALAELVWGAVSDLYVPLSVSRGYSSWTFIYDSLDILKTDLDVRVFYLGDHDPSGLDIERFTEEAVAYFDVDFELERVALTYGQIQAYGLLPNPTKKADPRAENYIAKYGDECWELDALEPRALQEIVRGAVAAEVDKSVWVEVERRNREARRRALEGLKRRAAEGV
jgi:hypothetical protein